MLIDSSGTFKLTDFGSATTQAMYPGTPGLDRGVCILDGSGGCEMSYCCAALLQRALMVVAVDVCKRSRVVYWLHNKPPNATHALAYMR